MLEELKKELRDKINVEYTEYIMNVITYPPNKIIDFSQEITIRDAFVGMFESDKNYDEDTIRFLLSKKNTLDYLYNCWRKCDYSLSSMLDENVIEPLYYEMMQNKNNLDLDSINNLKKIRYKSEERTGR